MTKIDKEMREMQKNINYIDRLVRNPDISEEEIIAKAMKKGIPRLAIRRAFDYWISWGDLVVEENLARWRKETIVR